MKRRNTLSIICILLVSAIFCSFWVLPVSAVVEAEAKALAKIDSALYEKMKTALPDEIIPVAIWYKDIDQTQVDKLTEEKIGFSKDDIALAYEMPSTELLSNLEKGEPEAIDEMQTYLKRTEAKREAERERTNVYVLNRREISREKYNAKSEKVINEIEIPEGSITFKSQYAPMIIALLSVSDIESVVYNSVIDSMYYDNWSADNEPQLVDTLELNNGSNVDYETEIDIIKNTVDQNDVVTELGLTGNDVLVGVIESGGKVNNDPEFNNNIINIGSDTYYKDHITEVTKRIVGSTSGFAPNAVAICTNTSYSNMELLLNYEDSDGNCIKLINMSHAVAPISGEIIYLTIDRWINHVVAQHGITVTVAANNKGTGTGAISSPGLAQNVITVGSYHPGPDNLTFTYDISDDRMAQSSSYNNGNCVCKPDVVMPGGSTSYATPFLTGSIALLFELKPALSSYPQVVKSIVLASCHRKVLSYTGQIEETPFQGLTDKQGAGAPSVLAMMSIVCQGTYGIGVMDASTTQKTIRFTQPSYGASNMNISLTWLKNNSYQTGISHSNENLVIEGDNVDLNMYVYHNGSLRGSSVLDNSSTEMTYFQLNSSFPDYEVRISKSTTTTEDVRYGFAYSTDNMLMTKETNEGVYRLKNLETGTYLTLDASTGELKHQGYADSSIQEWIVRQSSGWQISSAYGTTQGIINRSSTTLNTNNYKAVLGNNTLNFSMLQWYNNPTLSNKGGVVLYTYTLGTQMFLDYYSNYVTFASGTSNSTDSKIWILEKVNYIRGDANADGEYNTTDATFVQKYLSHKVTLNNLQLFLADANYDGVITIKDVTKIQNDITLST